MDGKRQDLRGRCRRHLCHQGRRDPQLQGDRRFTFDTSRCPPQFPLHPREPIVTLASARYSTRPPCSVEKRSLYREGRRQLAKSGVAVEKLPLLKKLSQPRDRKCPPKSRTSFIGHPSAMKFLRTSRV